MPSGGGSKGSTGGTRVDWFRTPDWDAPARAAFEARLARAKSFNRAQYRRIKALVLLNTGDMEKQQAGRTLLPGAVTAGDH